MRFHTITAITATLLLCADASAQISTTTTKSKSQTQTDTRTWQSPDGTQRRTHTDTTTTTRSKSVTIGTPATPPVLPGHPPPGSVYPLSLVGTWNVVVGQRQPCLLSLFKGFNAEGGGATTQGCPSTDLAAVGNWTTQGGGATLVLTKSLVVPVATLRRTGLHRFDGTASSGEPMIVWR